jgi:hypothetical protein
MADFRDICEIRDEEMRLVFAIITARTRRDGTLLYSFAFMREFEDEGSLRRASFLNERHTDAVLRLTPRVKAKLKELREAGEAGNGTGSHWP